MADPVLALAIAAQGQDVDEERARSPELDIVGGGIGQGDVALQQIEMQVEVQEGRRLQYGKRPFVGERNIRQAGVLQHVAGVLSGGADQPDLDLPALDEPSGRRELLQDAAVADELVVRDRTVRNRTKHAIVMEKDVAGRVPKGTWFGDAAGHRWFESGAPPRAVRLLVRTKYDFNLYQ